MRLSHIAILAIRGACPGIIKPLGKAMNVSDPSVYKYINDNNDNLTKAAAIQVIKDTTGLSEKEILEEDEVVPAGE